MKINGFGALVVENLMKLNELAAPAKENLIKTHGFAGLVMKSLLKVCCSVCFIMCFIYVSYMFHTPMWFCEHIFGSMNLWSCTRPENFMENSWFWCDGCIKLHPNLRFSLVAHYKNEETSGHQRCCVVQRVSDTAFQTNFTHSKICSARAEIFRSRTYRRVLFIRLRLLNFFAVKIGKVCFA